MKKQYNPSLFIIYPLLAWIYPILAFGAANLGQANPYAIIRPLLLLAILGIAIGFANRLWMKSKQQAALLTAWWGFLFSSYGHLYMKIENFHLGSLNLGRHRYLLILWVILALVGIWLIRKLPAVMNQWTRILNYTMIILVCLPVAQGVYYYLNQNQPVEATQNTQQPATAAPVSGKDQPDIYWLVLDSYARQDLLKNLYRYDNSLFVDYLKSKGFYVAGCSQSNYNHTWFSISTALNMNYLDQLTQDGKQARPVPLIKHSAVRDILTKAGYKSVAFETGFDFIDITDADYYLHEGDSWDLRSMFTAPINAFELMYMRTTVVTAILEMRGVSEDQIELTVKKDMMEYMYDHLPDIPAIDAPTFTYAHINTTHPPFFYQETAEQRSREDKQDPALTSLGAQTRLYRESIEYSNEKIEKVIDEILAKSKTPPIIIIQGDHGPFQSNSEEHIFDILNAYYFPGQDYSRLYPGISPVNSYRVVLNQFFQGSYEMLPDKSYFSGSKDDWKFEQVGRTCPK